MADKQPMLLVATHSRFRQSLVLCAALLALNGRAAVIPATWSGGLAGNWSTAGNWTPSSAYPKNATDTYTVSISGASVSLGEDIVIDSLALSDGDLNGAHALSVAPAGGLLFDGLNSLSGGLTLNVTGPFAFADDAAALTNHGTLVFKVSGSSNFTASAATFTNATDGVMGLAADESISIGGPGLSPFHLVNEGEFLVDNGSVNWVYAPVTNSGVIHVADAVLWLENGSNLGGTLQIDEGSWAFLEGESPHEFSQLSVSGLGSFQSILTSLTGSLASGVLMSDSTTFTDAFSIESAATLVWGDNNEFSAPSDTLTNRGTVRFVTMADSFKASSALFVNASGGVVTFDHSGYIGDANTAPFTLINQGTIVADNGTSNYVYVPVNSSGLVQVSDSSVIMFHADSTFGGSFNAEAGSSIRLMGSGNSTYTLAQLAVSGAGSAEVTMSNLTGSLKSGVLTASGIVFTNTFTVESAAILNWAGLNNRFEGNSNSLTNHGTVHFSAMMGEFTTSSSTFVNASDGVITFGSSGYIGAQGTVPFALVNQGTVRADNGKPNYIYAPVNSSGSVSATNTSSLTFNIGSTFGGAFAVDSNSSIKLAGGTNQTYNLVQLAISGAGSVSSDTISLTGSLKSGALTATRTLFTGSVSIETGATLDWGAQNSFALSSGTLLNHGYVQFETGANDFPAAPTGTFMNAVDGVISFVAGGQIGRTGVAPFSLSNYGTVVSGTNTTNQLYVPVTNSGTIRSTANSNLYLMVASNLGGTLQADTGSSIQLYGTGGQTQTLSQLTVTGAGSVSAHSTKLTGSLKAGSLSAETTTFTGGFSLEAAGTLHWGAQNRFSANSDTLLNHGYVVFETVSTDFPAASSATFINAVDGVLSFAAGGQIGSASIAPFALSNYGTVITGTATTNQLRVPVTNFGTLYVTSGSTLGLGSTFTQNSGEVFVDQGTLTALSAQTLYFNGGTLRGAGTITAPLSLAYTGLEIGAGSTAGSLGVTGATTFGTGSSFRVDLNGTSVGTGYDRLYVTGTVTLGGDLMVRVGSGFLSSITNGNSFTVLSATGITGAFANVTSGQRAKLPSGLGSCLLTVSGTQVILSDFTSSTLNDFLATAGVPAASRGYDQDPDGDGVTNLMEYALALNPMTPDAGGLPTSQVSGGNLTLTYYKQRKDVVYEVITTTTLSDPGSWTTTGVTQGTPDVNKKVTASVPLTGGKAFLRLRVNYAP